MPEDSAVAIDEGPAAGIATLDVNFFKDVLAELADAENQTAMLRRKIDRIRGMIPGSANANGSKNFSVPAGSIIKIGGCTYSLKDAVEVEGFREPRWRVTPDVGDEDCQD